jgi:hypothetical protein
MASHLVTAAVESLRLARRVARQRVGGEQRQRDGGVRVADDRVGEAVGIDLAPAHGLRRRRARQTARVRPRVGELQEVVVALLLDAHHLLDLRLRLQHEVLGAPPPKMTTRRLAAAALAIQHDGRRLVHVGIDVELQLQPLERPAATFMPMDESPGDDV